VALLRRRTKTFLARHLLIRRTVLSSSPELAEVERVPRHVVQNQLPRGQLPPVNKHPDKLCTWNWLMKIITFNSGQTWYPIGYHLISPSKTMLVSKSENIIIIHPSSVDYYISTSIYSNEQMPLLIMCFCTFFAFRRQQTDLVSQKIL